MGLNTFAGCLVSVLFYVQPLHNNYVKSATNYDWPLRATSLRLRATSVRLLATNLQKYNFENESHTSGLLNSNS